MGLKNKVIKTSFVKKVIQKKVAKKTASNKKIAKQSGGKGAAKGPYVASVSVMKKVNWLNQQGIFGKDQVDEDALEMLGSLPKERGMSILDNMEAKAESGEIWNPNSYIVKAVLRHSKGMEKGMEKGMASNSTAGADLPAHVSVLKKVNWMNRQGMFGKHQVDEDAIEMLGSLPEDRAMSILENMELKAGAGEIWNPNSYVVNATIRHTKELSIRTSKGPLKGKGKGKGKRQREGTKGKGKGKGNGKQYVKTIAVYKSPFKKKGKGKGKGKGKSKGKGKKKGKW